MKSTFEFTIMYLHCMSIVLQAQNGASCSSRSSTPHSSSDTFSNGHTERQSSPSVNEAPIVVKKLSQPADNSRASSVATESNGTSSVPASPTTSTKSASSSGMLPPAALGDSDLNLNMSVSQMRQMLAQKKKHDPKKATMDLRQKYEIIQQM